jgi:hypothetical protein
MTDIKNGEEVGLSVSCDQIKNIWVFVDIRMTRIKGKGVVTCFPSKILWPLYIEIAAEYTAMSSITKSNYRLSRFSKLAL